MKLKNICLAVLTAYSLSGTTFTHGSQRFINMARYASAALSSFSTSSGNPRKLSAITSAAARLSQPVKQEKTKFFQKEPVKWPAAQKLTAAGVGLGTGLALNPLWSAEEIKETETIEAPQSIEIRTRLEALFASTGITIKINLPLKDYGDEIPSWGYANILAVISALEKKGKVTLTDLISFFVDKRHVFSSLDNNTIALTLLINLCDKNSPGSNRFSWLFDLILSNEDKVYCMKQLIEHEALANEYPANIKDMFEKLPLEQRTPLALLFFEKSFENLDSFTLDSFTIECLLLFLKKLPLEDKIDGIKRLIENGKLQQCDSDAIEQTFNLVDPAQQIPLVSLFLEKLLNTELISISTLKVLLTKLPLQDQITWIKRLIENGGLQKKSCYEIFDIFILLPSPERAPLICLFLKTSLDTLDSWVIEHLLEELPLEDRIKCVKQLLENGKLEQKHFRKINTVFYTLPEEQRSSLTLFFLEKYFDALSEYDIKRTIHNVLPEDGVPCIKQLIENRKLETQSLDITKALFNRLLSNEEGSELALLFLEKSFDVLDEHFTTFLITLLSLEAEKGKYTKKLIESKNIENLDPETLNELFKPFPEEERSRLASLFLEKSCNSLLESGSLRALPIFINQLSSETEKANYLHQVIESRKIETFDADQIERMLKPLSPEAQIHWALSFLEGSYGELPDATLKNLINYCPEGLKEFWFEEFAKKNNFLNSFISELTQGPLFSFEFIMKHHAQIMGTFSNKDEAEKAETLIKKAGIFAAQEYAKGNIVLFHGQHDQWAFFEKIFKALLKIKYNTPISKNYAWVRFIEQALLSDEEVAEIRRDGVTGSTYTKYRPKVLFTNLHLLANHRGSNSLQYVLSNSDQSAKDQFDATISKNQFIELGMEPEYKQLQAEDPQLFENLYQLHKKEVLARGNVGRLIGISLPKKSASELCYSTESRGPLHPHTINDEKTTDITTIAENYDQVGFHNEHALILSDLITNPEKAAAAGISMETFTSDQTEESKKYADELEVELTKVMNKIADRYYARILREALNE
jgi:hypothetical protein